MSVGVPVVSVSGKNVLGKYQILREIARSNDVVYEAIDPAMGRRLAIKELLLPQHLSPTQRRERIARFYREAKAAGTLTHPNIVTIHDVGNDGDRHFIAMEYLDGHSLREVLRMRGALPVAEAVEVALQLCNALGYAHAHGIVHRDVKPDNVHSLSGGAVKLTDFGIAAITAEPSMTAQGQVFGTPSYMSPEQVASSTVDNRSDIFSFGVMFFEILTGRKPFQGDSVITITYNIMNMEPILPPSIPAGLHPIIRRALAKEPNQRYQNMALVAADLNAEKYSMLSGYFNYQSTQMPGQNRPSQHDVKTQLGQPAALSNVRSGITQVFHRSTDGTLTPALETNFSNAGVSLKPTLIAAGTVIGLFAVVLGMIFSIIFFVNRGQATKQRVQAKSLIMQGTQAQQAGNYDTAAARFDEARKTAPDTPEASAATKDLSSAEVNKGNQATAANDPAAAAAAYQSALQVDGNNAVADDNLGTTQAQQGDIQSALKSWQAAMVADRSSAAGIDAQRRSTAAYMQMAQVASSHNDSNNALAYWQKVIEISPGSPEALQAQQMINSAPIANNGETVTGSGTNIQLPPSPVVPNVNP